MSVGGVWVVPIRKWHLAAPAGVLALWKSSPQPGYVCGFHMAAALAGTGIYHLWADTM